MTPFDERRQFQRLNLLSPLDGWFGDYSVRLIDVSATGAQLESDETIPDDARALLRFYWRGEEVELLAETARQLDGRIGVRFVEDTGALRNLIAASAAELLQAQEANARGDRERNVIGDETLTAASVSRSGDDGFVTWLFLDGSWKRSRSLLPDQPENGFTIGASEPEEQVQMLRQTYEAGDAEARRLTRLLAELSVAASS